MICTAADGAKVPIAVVGTAMKPVCFRLCTNGKPPLPYNKQEKGWFDREVTVWWIENVFWPAHKKYGNSHAILVLDNCPAHHGIDNKLIPDKLHIIFLPENMTSNHQPADMGMIAALKVGYRVIMLSKLLKIFDQEGGWEAAELLRGKMVKGLKGLEYDGKATVLDAMLIVHDIWKVDGRYESEDGIRRCWRKAGILSIAMETAINADLGSNSTPAAKKKLSKEDCDELCFLLKTLHVNGNQVREEVKKTPLCFKGSYIVEGDFEGSEWEKLANEWNDIEDNVDILMALKEEKYEAEKAGKIIVADVSDDAYDSEPEVEVVPTEIEENDNCYGSYLECEEGIQKVLKSFIKWGVDDAVIANLHKVQRGLQSHKLSTKKRETSLLEHGFECEKKNN